MLPLLRYFSFMKAKPNVLVILADDLGWNDIGLNNPYLKTPNIDSLIKDSLHLQNYYVSPMCTPTRSILMSGRYQIHTGLQHNVILGMQPNGHPLNDIFMPEVLQNCGYDTHMIGKWHLGFYKVTKSCDKYIVNPHLHERVSNHRDQKYIGEVSF